MTAACVQPAVAGGRAKLQSRYRRGMGRGAVTAINDAKLIVTSKGRPTYQCRITGRGATAQCS